MAVYTFTASAVVPGGSTLGAIAGEQLAAGDVIYLDAADGSKAKKAECDGVVDKAKVAGIVVNSAYTGQPVSYVATGDVTVDAAAFGGVGRLLVLSPTAGKLMDVGDLINGQFVSLVGWSIAVNKLKLDLALTGLART
ncbi:MAG: hypothetical protein LC135_05470 [Phycisphaerae bacterium]|jgi:hypothetical protein|nr:hypothetical protein [Phycisphaerae bacterium]MCZ2399304.1 hypothetical protein [Phycisphaerae bacterium]NUQ48540.1 hypothetical protein [Phycisphaerae bacterium]